MAKDPVVSLGCIGWIVLEREMEGFCGDIVLLFYIQSGENLFQNSFNIV